MLGQVVRGIAEARKLPQDQVASLIDRGPFFADDAKAAQLVDRIGYRDEAVARAHERAGSGAELVSISRYLGGAGRPHDSGAKIALIYGTGLITAGDGGGSLGGDEEMSARKLTRAFRQAVRDDKVRAILFRIDSPGGSAVASETIWREVVFARERGKPVVVSMGEVAGSGGYYVAAPADKIVAEPATLTGSIGVLAGKLVVSGLLQKLGITTDAVETGANAGMFSAVRDFSPEALQRLNTLLDVTYRGFKQHVAAGRHLSDDQVEAVAKGRVWTGEEAKAKGLVDELGGYATALRLAKEAAKIPPDEGFRLTLFPRTKGTLERIYDRLANRDSDNEADQRSTFERALTGLDTLAARLDALIGEHGVLRMPDLGEVR
jgi:protease-4